MSKLEKMAPTTSEKVQAGLKRRYAAERRFRRYGAAAVGIALAALATLFGTIIANGYTAFGQTQIRLTVTLDADSADYDGLIKQALFAKFPDATTRNDRRALASLLSSGADLELRRMVEERPTLVGKVELWVPADDDVDMLVKGRISRAPGGRVSAQQIAWIDQLAAEGRLEQRFNTRFFTGGDSREPELAGILGAAAGSALTMLVTLALSFPLGVGAAIYLEEFAPKNRWTDIIEININNLAAVPSIVFGLLALAIFLNTVGLPRSAPLVGGMTLALITLPTIIIAARAALKTVPPSIREAAMGVGASRSQTVFHHVLPLAMPGILSGTIIGMAQALGETAPLLMIGMVAFIVDIPSGITDPATALPVQIFLWADSPERAFVERTSAAILVLLAFLVAMNAVGVWLRKRFETRW